MENFVILTNQCRFILPATLPGGLRKAFFLLFAIVASSTFALAQLPPGVTFDGYKLDVGDVPNGNAVPIGWTIEQGQGRTDNMDLQWVNMNSAAWFIQPNGLFPSTITKIFCGVFAVSDVPGKFRSNASTTRGTSISHSVSGLTATTPYRYSFIAAANQYRDSNYPLPNFPCYDDRRGDKIVLGLFVDGILAAQQELNVGVAATSVNLTFVASSATHTLTIGVVVDPSDIGCRDYNPWYQIAAGTGKFELYETCNANAGITTLF